jgi:hypothetical protein
MYLKHHLASQAPSMQACASAIAQKTGTCQECLLRRQLAVRLCVLRSSVEEWISSSPGRSSVTLDRRGATMACGFISSFVRHGQEICCASLRCCGSRSYDIRASLSAIRAQTGRCIFTRAISMQIDWLSTRYGAQRQN